MPAVPETPAPATAAPTPGLRGGPLGAPFQTAGLGVISQDWGEEQLSL